MESWEMGGTAAKEGYESPELCQAMFDWANTMLLSAQIKRSGLKNTSRAGQSAHSPGVSAVDADLRLPHRRGDIPSCRPGGSLIVRIHIRNA